ncbi:urease accessory protein UreF [Mycobacterium sp. MS1601]|uniref:urease accessory protein UreF n=1 Tax=Mycobacterium sp. MS1601 TaxID=1936029 RepID=UPI0009F9B2EE|nr:urease accessory UreF family protein [Mycobacterium sp. MS1601]
MTDNPAALALWMQLHDSAFPAGRMVHSNGFEEWLALHPCARGAEIEVCALDYLTFAVATLDATVTAAAWRATPSMVTLCELDTVLTSYKLTGNARSASQTAGRQLAVTAQQVGLCSSDGYLTAVIAGSTPGNLAVVEGAVQAAIGVSVHTAVLGSLRSALAAVLSAAVRLGRLGPLEAQRIQVRSVEGVVALADAACSRPLEEMASTTMQLEIAGMRHENRSQRLFAS